MSSLCLTGKGLYVSCTQQLNTGWLGSHAWNFAQCCISAQESDDCRTGLDLSGHAALIEHGSIAQHVHRVCCLLLIRTCLQTGLLAEEHMTSFRKDLQLLPAMMESSFTSSQ